MERDILKRIRSYRCAFIVRGISHLLNLSVFSRALDCTTFAITISSGKAYSGEDGQNHNSRKLHHLMTLFGKIGTKLTTELKAICETWTVTQGVILFQPTGLKSWNLH